MTWIPHEPLEQVKSIWAMSGDAWQRSRWQASRLGEDGAQNGSGEGSRINDKLKYACR